MREINRYDVMEGGGIIVMVAASIFQYWIVGIVWAAITLFIGSGIYLISYISFEKRTSTQLPKAKIIKRNT